MVVALLAPYAGCNQILSSTHTESERAAETEYNAGVRSRHSAEADANKREPLNQIEELLSD